MKNTRILYIILVVTVSFLFFNACKKGLKSNLWQTDFSSPLVKTQLSLANVLADTLLIKNSDNTYSLKYHSNLTSIKLDTIANLPDTTIKNALHSIFNFSLQPGSPIYNSTQVTRFDAKNVQLMLATISSGKLVMTFESTIKESVIFTYTIPKATLNGQAFTITETLSAATSTQLASLTKEYDLSNYKLDLKGSLGNSSNKIEAQIVAIINPLGAAVNITTNDSLIIKTTFKKIKPYYAKGSFGKQLMSVNSSTAVKPLTGIAIKNLSLDKLNLTIGLKNYTGIDATIKIKRFYAKNTVTNQQVDLIASSVINQTIFINRTLDAGDINKLQAQTNTLSLTSANSNIKSLLEIIPNEFGYELEMMVNPLGNISGANDFIYFDKSIVPEINMELPLKFAFESIQLVDTVVTDFSSLKDVKNISEARLVLHVNNKFPVNTALQMYLLNEKGFVMDSLLANAFVASSALNNNGTSATAVKSQLSFVITKDRLSHLIATKKIKIKALINTTNYPQHIVFDADNIMDVQLVGTFVLNKEDE